MPSSHARCILTSEHLLRLHEFQAIGRFSVIVDTIFRSRLNIAMIAGARAGRQCRSKARPEGSRWRNRALNRGMKRAAACSSRRRY